jgi:hypothetical protein
MLTKVVVMTITAVRNCRPVLILEVEDNKEKIN